MIARRETVKMNTLVADTIMELLKGYEHAEIADINEASVAFRIHTKMRFIRITIAFQSGEIYLDEEPG